MAATVRRAPQTVRRQSRKEGTQRQVRKAQARTGSVLGAVLRVLPFTEEQLQRALLVLILGGLAALAWFVASLAGVPAMAGQRLAMALGDAGYEVRHVEVRGVERMNELAVYERVLGQRDRAMPLVNLGELRDSLLELPWVEDARVSRQLPDTLVVDIVEREPHAVLDEGGRLVVIDRGGHELEPVSRSDAAGQLIISGPGAQSQVAALEGLLDAAPALRPQVASAEWIGDRRWNLTFTTGQVLSLPQGDERAAGALMSFARLDGVNRLIGGKVASFDMRNPDRIYLRVPGRASEALAAKEDS